MLDTIKMTASYYGVAVMASRKGIKKGHCLVHGKLNAKNSAEEKTKNGVRRKCIICKSNNDHISQVNRIIKGTQCQKHGMAKNAENNYQCRKCKNEWNNKDRALNPEKYRKWVKECRDRDRQKYRMMEVARVHGLTLVEYKDMVDKQKGLCAICNGKETRFGRNGKEVAKLCVDHDHVTGKIRGLLCHSCNTGIGKLKDSIDVLKLAIKYLRKHE